MPTALDEPGEVAEALDVVLGFAFESTKRCGPVADALADGALAPGAPALAEADALGGAFSMQPAIVTVDAAA